MKSIFSYTQYRQYLRDYYAYRKSHYSGYSYARFAHEAGLNSPNYLSLVSDGKRNLTISNIHQFANVLQFKDDELRYFESLVLENQAENENEKKFYRRRLSEIRSSKPKVSTKVKSHPISGKWYFPALLLMLHGRTRAEVENLVTTELGLPSREGMEAIDLVLQSGLVKQDGSQFKLLIEHLTIQDQKSMAVAQEIFIREQLSLSVEHFKHHYKDGRAKFVSHTMTAPKHSVVAVADGLHEKCENLSAKFDSEDTEEASKEILQINIQVFKAGLPKKI